MGGGEWMAEEVGAGMQGWMGGWEESKGVETNRSVK